MKSAKKLLVMWRTSDRVRRFPSILTMIDPQTAISMSESLSGDEEPEQEDLRRNSLTCGESSALIVKPPPLENLKTYVRCGVESPLGYGTNVTMQYQSSILRMSASKTSRSHGLKKSSSVEFVLDHTHQEVAQSIHASTSSIGREPRRLTFEEKAELYRIRPDLEIGPAPYYNEKADELNRRNRRRVIFAMFGGMISMVLLFVFFSMWEYNK